MLKVALNRMQVIQLIQEVAQHKIDDLTALFALSKFCDSDIDIKSEKQTILVGSEKAYKVVGVTFEGRQEHIKQLKSNDVLCFEHEHDNIYDPNAIAVKTMQGVQIGYLDKELAPKLLDVIAELSGVVTQILNDNNDDAAAESKFWGIRFKFIRKIDLEQPPAINLDAITMLISHMDVTAETRAREVLETIDNKAPSTNVRENKAEPAISPARPSNQDDEMIF